MTTTDLRRLGVREDDDGDDGRGGGGGGGGIPHRKLILAGIGVVLVAAIAVWLVAFSSVFGVGTVDIRGVHTLSAAKVRSVAAVADGTPLVRLDTDAIRRRVEALPGVASVSVTTSFPTTVTITVNERVPIGVVASRAGFVLVDRTGDQFRRVERRPPHLPLFVVPDGTDARTTGGAVATVAAALPADLLARIASIQALDPNAITLVLRGDRIVRWGSADRSDDKARVLPALLRVHGTQFDVTDPDQPFVR
ncbi:MAG: cell division protein FtsQ/DivIB [Jatrophihabitantaceae bacterium]